MAQSASENVCATKTTVEEEANDARMDNSQLMAAAQKTEDDWLRRVFSVPIQASTKSIKDQLAAAEARVAKVSAGSIISEEDDAFYHTVIALHFPAIVIAIQQTLGNQSHSTLEAKTDEQIDGAKAKRPKGRPKKDDPTAPSNQRPIVVTRRSSSRLTASTPNDAPLAGSSHEPPTKIFIPNDVLSDYLPIRVKPANEDAKVDCPGTKVFFCASDTGEKPEGRVGCCTSCTLRWQYLRGNLTGTKFKADFVKILCSTRFRVPRTIALMTIKHLHSECPKSFKPHKWYKAFNYRCVDCLSHVYKLNKKAKCDSCAKENKISLLRREGKVKRIPTNRPYEETKNRSSARVLVFTVTRASSYCTSPPSEAHTAVYLFVLNRLMETQTEIFKQLHLPCEFIGQYHGSGSCLSTAVGKTRSFKGRSDDEGYYGSFRQMLLDMKDHYKEGDTVAICMSHIASFCVVPRYLLEFIYACYRTQIPLNKILLCCGSFEVEHGDPIEYEEPIVMQDIYDAIVHKIPPLPIPGTLHGLLWSAFQAMKGRLDMARSGRNNIRFDILEN